MDQVDDSTEKEALKYLIYLDQILIDGNKQDSMCVFALIDSALNIPIEQFIHTETQDGKTVLDAHFARCKRFLKVFMKTWRMNYIT